MLSPSTALSVIERIEANYNEALTGAAAGPINQLADYLSRGDLGEKAQQLPRKFRGIFEPFACDLYERQIVLYLAALYIASQEDTTRLEFQSPDISTFFKVRPGEALAFLLGKRVVTRAEFDRLTAAEQIRAFTVSRVSERRMLESIKQEIVRNLVEGKSQKELVNELQKMLPDFARSRLQLIAHQNLRQAAMAGRFEQMVRSRKRYPYVQWKTMGDDRVRPAHRALHNQIWPIEQMPFWPPLGFRCRCWVIQLGPNQLPAGQPIIRGPGVYRTMDGDPLLVDADNQYALPNRPLTFEFTNMPIRDREALDISREFRDMILQRGVFTDTPNQSASKYESFLGEVFDNEAAEVARTLAANEPFFVYNASPEPLYRIVPGAGELFVDVHQYTQNDHFITTFVEKALALGLTREQVELKLKASTMEGFPYKQSEEILKASIDSLAAGRPSGVVGRSTEYVLRFRSADPALVRRLALELLDVAEKHGDLSTLRRLTSEAWIWSDIRVVGLGQITDPGLSEQWGQKGLFATVHLYYRRVGNGEVVKLYKTVKSRPGWDGHYSMGL